MSFFASKSSQCRWSQPSCMTCHGINCMYSAPTLYTKNYVPPCGMTKPQWMWRNGGNFTCFMPNLNWIQPLHVWDFHWIIMEGECVACVGHVHFQSKFHAHFMLSIHFCKKTSTFPHSSPTSQFWGCHHVCCPKIQLNEYLV